MSNCFFNCQLSLESIKPFIEDFSDLSLPKIFQKDTVPQQKTILQAKNPSLLRMVFKIDKQIGYFLNSNQIKKNIKCMIINRNNDLYIGQEHNHKPQGLGEIYFADGEYLIGIFKEGLLTQQYRYIQKNGNCYQIIIEPQTNIKKAIIMTDKFIYQGQIDDSKPNGNGMEKTDNYQFVGKYVNGNKFYGKINFAQNQYQGQIRNNLFQGWGQLKTADGFYSGQFKAGKKHGQGEFYWKDGTIYRGEYQNDKKHGKGTYIKNGTEYRGQWRQGTREGNGCIKTQSKMIGGEWKQNRYSFPEKYF